MSSDAIGPNQLKLSHQEAESQSWAAEAFNILFWNECNFLNANHSKNVCVGDNFYHPNPSNFLVTAVKNKRRLDTTNDSKIKGQFLKK